MLIGHDVITRVVKRTIFVQLNMSSLSNACRADIDCGYECTESEIKKTLKGIIYGIQSPYPITPDAAFCATLCRLLSERQ